MFMMPSTNPDLRHPFFEDVVPLMPPMAQIPREFHNGQMKWNQLACDWFFYGIRLESATPKAGIDVVLAWRHLGAIQRSFTPKHEHKEAAVAYLLSEWFEDVQYTRKERQHA